MNEVFTNREIAAGFWIAVLLLWAASYPDSRRSFGHVIKAFLNKYIIWTIFWTSTYVLILFSALAWLGVWDLRHLKITVYWFLSEAMITVFRSNQQTSNPGYFRQAVRDNIRLVVVLEYVVNLYSFTLVTELILFPFIAVAGLMLGLSEGKKEYARLQGLLNALLATYFIALLLHAVHRALKETAELAAIDWYSDLLLPVALSGAFLPFMYLLLTFLAYEQAFLQIRFAIPKELIEEAKRLSFRRFRGDRLLLLRWARVLSYTGVANRDQLIESIDQVRFMKWREEHTSVVTFSHGWSPRSAAAYLSVLGISVGDYNPSFDGIWTASSQYLSLKDESPILCNNISYYIYGEQSYVRQLKLMLNVNQPDEAADAHARFLETCEMLTEKSLDRALSDEAREAVLTGGDRCEVICERMVTVQRHDWALNANGAYEIRFEICHPEFKRR